MLFTKMLDLITPNKEFALELANKYCAAFECIEDGPLYTIRMYYAQLYEILQEIKQQRIPYQLRIYDEDLRLLNRM